MATLSKLGKGTILAVGDGASPEVFTQIPELLEISGSPGGTPDLVDVTNHDTTGLYREEITGLITTTELVCRANYRKAGTSDNTTVLALRTQMEAGTVKNFRITLPTTTPQIINFAARVRSWNLVTPITEQMRVEFTLKSEGAPAY
jgi:predicted secreted protein